MPLRQILQSTRHQISTSTIVTTTLKVKKVINKHKSRSLPPNLTRNQRETLSEMTTLKKGREVRISVSDKGGEFVVMDSNLDNTLMEKHLGNESLYRPCHDLMKKAEEEINEVWEYAAKKESC